MRVSVHSFSFHPMIRAGTMDLFGSLETVRYRYGLRCADIWDLALASRNTSYIHAVRRALMEREMELISLNVSSYWLWDADPGVRNYNERLVPAYLRIAEALGAQTVCVDAGGHVSGEAFTPREFDYMVTLYRQYAQRAYDNGYRIGPENHYGAEALPQEMLRLCKAVDHPGFGMLLHVGRWQGDDASRGDAMLAPWVMHVHLDDNLTHGELVESMTRLRDADYDGAWSVEVERDGTYAQVGAMVARIERVLERWRLESAQAMRPAQVRGGIAGR